MELIGKCRVPFYKVDWTVSSFLILSFVLSIILTPIYVYQYFSTIDWAFHLTFFMLTLWASGLSITFGYHRMFAHRAFQSVFPLRLFVLLFGAAAFQNSVLSWASDHRRHHKHVDEDEDPYDINKGLFWAHIGWLLFRLCPKPGFENVKDLQKDPWVVWQHKWCQLIAVIFAFLLPTAVGYAWGYYFAGAERAVEYAIGAFLIGGLARVVFLQHCTFCINSLCHWVGSRPYSDRCSARDSFFMALLTFGEGYHNYHHAFQYDYRNGVKPWQYDPTKWLIWAFSKVGMTYNLRRVDSETVMKSEIEVGRKKILEKSGFPDFADFPQVSANLLQSAEDALLEAARQLDALRKPKKQEPAKSEEAELVEAEQEAREQAFISRTGISTIDVEQAQREVMECWISWRRAVRLALNAA